MKMNVKTAIAAMSVVLLMGAADGAAGAASSSSQKRSKSTAPVVQIVKTDPSIQQLLDKEYAVKLQTGEIRVGYINHAKSNPDDTLDFSYMPYRFADISEAAQKQLALTGKTLEEPGDLPEGFVFQEALLEPYIPFFLGPDYKKLKNQLKAEAVASGKKVIFKKYKWTSGSAMLTYTKGAERIRFHYGPAAVLPEGATYAILPGDEPEDLIINGREAVYTKFGPHHGDFKAELTWSSGDGSKDYKITVNKNSSLAKEDLEAIAATLIAP
ncbi:hypothetical protein [Paenibacillus riograndensis]|uniref:Putative secreted protein n=1 Tax=Paenibacillus riograndensis SBR5 TaxID=1073571 RepID=A0A0E3WGJ6_9BACL|nr:hypothetical protein [Paenibacillus riograndensis]CQR53209.1 putative secreted protein [Paenibacillus riograndensis SBR5]